MRVGIGYNGGPQHRQNAIRETGVDQNPDGQVMAYQDDGTWTGFLYDKKYSLHVPVIPDDQYASWQFSPHNRAEWAEMFFTVGTGTVSGTLAIQGFQYTDSSWKQDIAQFGIGQGWIEIDHDLGLENVRFNAKIGSHWARYGMAGVYDAGEYDTYLFGRTHTIGATVRMDMILPSFDVAFEGGVGAKTPDPKMFNRARFTTLAHGHAFLKFPSVEFSLNGMHAWSAQETVPNYPNYQPGSGGCDYNNSYGAQCTINDDQILPPDGSEFVGGVGGVEGDLSVYGPEYPHGSQTVLGADVRWDLGLLGYLYAGYSYQFLKNSLIVDNAIESVHSLGAGNYSLGIVDNYLESPFCAARQGDPFYATAPNESCSNGDGAVGSALLQYELGLANFGIFPGDMDLKTKVYGMFNHVSVDDIEAERLADLYSLDLADAADAAEVESMRQNGTIKWKVGADAEFFPGLDWVSFGLRFDRLNPTNNELLKSFHGYSILSPRIVFRTKMVTHEEISIQYSRYFYDQRECVTTDASGSATRVSSPADDPFRIGGGDAVPGNSIYQGENPVTGYPLNLYCTQPPSSPRPPYGFGSTSTGQDPGLRGAATLIPDENVVKLEASMWW